MTTIREQLKNNEAALAELQRCHTETDKVLVEAEETITDLRQRGQELETLFLRLIRGEINPTYAESVYYQMKAESSPWYADKKLFE